MANDCHGVHAHVDRYLEDTRYVLDQLRAGNLTEGEAIRLHSEYSTRVTVAMTDAFVARLLEATGVRLAGQAAAVVPAEAYPIPYVHRAHTPAAHLDQECGRSHGPIYPTAEQAATPEGE